MTPYLIADRNLLKSLNLDTSVTYSANDFELALRNYSVLKNGQRYKEYLEDLNWFQLDSPETYAANSIDAYASYLTYAILKNFFYQKEIIKIDMEKYFTNQLIGYLEVRRKLEPNTLKDLMKYYSKVDALVDRYIHILSKYSVINSAQNCYFTCYKDQFKIDVPIVAFTSSNTIDVFLILPYSKKKPNWFTIPSIYKMYKYYADLDIIISNLHITWLRIDSFFTPPTYETIKFSENVATAVGMYADLSPYPFENIFSKENKKYYAITPLSEITRGATK